MVISQGFHSEGLPHSLGVFIVLIADMVVGKLAVECFLWWEFCLSESFEGVYVLVGEYTFLF
jgi:hypothetical protein